MAQMTIANSPTSGKVCSRHGNSATFSTATLPGLIQAYARAGEALQPYFYPKPEGLVAALKNAERKDHTMFLLSKGSLAVQCLDCLNGGETELLRSYLTTLASDLFRQAEKQGA